MEPWESEVAISPAIAKAIIRKSVPGYKVSSVKPFAQGWDKTAFLVNDHLLFQFTRRKIAISGIEAEIKLLPLIGKFLSIPVPAPVHSGYFADGFPFFSYPLLKGEMIVDKSFDREQREELAPQLAKALKELHNIRVDGALKQEIPDDNFGKMDIEKRKKQIIDHWSVIKRLGLDISTDLRFSLTGNLSKKMVKSRQCIVHGDLYSRHILVENGEISGIIDWGDMHLNHPARDLSFAANYLHPDAFKIFREIYGGLDNNTLLLSLFSGLNHTLYVGDYALKIGDDNLIKESRIAIQNIFDNYSSFTALQG